MAKNGAVTIEWRLKQIENANKHYDEVLFGEHGILTNHIPHMEQDIISLSTKMNILTAVNVAAIVLALIVNKFLQ